jgi:hypothetical protein
MNQDYVFWGVIICLAGAIIVPSWLLFRAYINATKDQDKK